MQLRTLGAAFCLLIAPVAVAQSPHLARVDSDLHAAVMRGDSTLDVVLTVQFDPVPLPWAPPGTTASESGRAEKRAFLTRLERVGATRLYDSNAGSIDLRIPARAIDSLRRDRAVLAIEARQTPQSFSNLVSIRDIIKVAPYAPVPLTNAKGLNQEVVVIDAGFDPDNPALASGAGPFASGYQIREECFSTSNKCRTALNQPTNRASGPGATRVSDPPPAGQVPLYHGALVAQIIGSQNRVHPFGASFEGVAPATTLTLVSVFDGWKADGSPDYDPTSINNALDWVIQQVNPAFTSPPRPIRAVNLSFGAFPNNNQTCETMAAFNPYRSRIQALNSFGVAVIAASGNTATRPVALPACIDEVISVGESLNSVGGATTLSPFTTFGTVGRKINVAAPADTTQLVDRLANPSTYFLNDNRFGSSFSAPSVAGCFTLLAEKLSPGKYSPFTMKSAVMSGFAQATRTGAPFFSTSLLNCYQVFQAAEFGTGSISLNRFGLSGSWYDASSGGQGLVIEVAQPQSPTQSGVLFGAWFTYSRDVQQPNERGLRWYTLQSAPANWTSSDFATDVAVLESGPASFMVPNSPGASIITLVGTGRIKFNSCNHAELTWDRCDVAGSQRPVGPPLLTCTNPIFGGVPTNATSLAYQRGTQRMVRLGPTNDCSEAVSSGESESEVGGRASSNRLPRSLTGVWNPYDPANPSVSYAGQGLLFDVYPGLAIGGGGQGAFGAWFAHARAGDPSPGDQRLRWWTLQLPEEVVGSNGLAYDFKIAYARGGRFAISPPVPNIGWVGNATLTFDPNCRNATLTYRFFTGSFLDPPGSEQMPGFVSPTAIGTIHLRKGTLPNDPACMVPLP